MTCKNRALRTSETGLSATPDWDHDHSRCTRCPRCGGGEGEWSCEVCQVCEGRTPPPERRALRTSDEGRSQKVERAIDTTTCPTCGALPTRPCRTRAGFPVTVWAHPERVAAATDHASSPTATSSDSGVTP